MKKNNIGYNLWKGYGENKWLGKWGNGKDCRWYLFRIWMWIGKNYGYIRKYNIKRDKILIKTKTTLEKAYTDQLKEILRNSLNTSDET